MIDGIAGVYSPGDSELVHKIFLATGSNQNRGKACAGIGVGTKKRTYYQKDLGRIGDVVDPEIMQAFQDLDPIAAIGNVGYTKNKYPAKINSEPIRINPKKVDTKYEVLLTMDGYLVKEDDLISELETDYNLETNNKTEIVGALLHKYISEEGISFEAGKKLVDKLHGRATFALVSLVRDGKEIYMISLNDDRAFEPFCYGKINDAFVVSSESISHGILGGSIERECDGAEMTICSPRGIEIERLRKEIMMPDIFQAIYFGHPGSLFKGKEIFQIRRRLGWGLVDHYKTSRAERVIYNPDSGLGVSTGIAEALVNKGILKLLPNEKLPLDKLEDLLPDLLPMYSGLMKNAQAVRTFPEAEKTKRMMEVKIKFSGIGSLLKDLYILIGDDSIVKGSVSEGGSNWWLYNCGAKYVEFWVSYGAMLLASFKEWSRGIECLNELAVQRAFKDNNPYDKTHDEINKEVAKLTGVNKVRYNLQSRIEKVTGKGSFQALDASYPIEEKFWPDWLRTEVDKFRRYRIIKT